MAAAKRGLPSTTMTVLTPAELERLLFEDVPYGDPTTDALRSGDVGCCGSATAPRRVRDVPTPSGHAAVKTIPGTKALSVAAIKAGGSRIGCGSRRQFWCFPNTACWARPLILPRWPTALRAARPTPTAVLLVGPHKAMPPGTSLKRKTFKLKMTCLKPFDYLEEVKG